jgi:HSP20 family protein
MAMMRWKNYPNLFDFFDSLFDREKEEVEGTNYYYTVPAVNIIETDKAFELEVAAPGFSKSDFKITVENNVLRIASDVSKAKEKEEKKMECLRQEFAYGKFARSFSLPNIINTEKISAEYKDGILHVILPKREELTISKQVAIQ